MVFRKGTYNDLDNIFEIKEEALTAYKGTIAWSKEYPTRETFGRDIEKEELFVLEEDGDIVAIAVLNMQEDIYYKNIPWEEKESFIILHRVLVAPKYSRQGRGKRLLSEIDKHIVSKGIKSIRLDVKTTNDKAQNLYKCMGYKVLGEMPLEGRIGTWYGMQKILI